MTTILTACAMYVLSAKLDCQALAKDSRASCAWDAGWGLEMETPQAEVSADYKACKVDAWNEYTACLRDIPTICK